MSNGIECFMQAKEKTNFFVWFFGFTVGTHNKDCFLFGLTLFRNAICNHRLSSRYFLCPEAVHIRYHFVNPILNLLLFSFIIIFLLFRPIHFSPSSSSLFCSFSHLKFSHIIPYILYIWMHEISFQCYKKNARTIDDRKKEKNGIVNVRYDL